jgi:broad specificity phosphatase PhoE
MTIFYICRHGETENNKAQRFSGWIDTPLTETGIKDAESSANKLALITLDKIVSSDLGRAFTTAYIILRKLGYAGDIDRLSGLREVNYGNFGNQPYSVYPQMTPLENADFISPNGESLRQMQDRVLACLKDISQKYEGKTVLIAAHDGTVNAIRASFTNEDIGIADGTHNAHDFVAKFEYESGKVTSFDEQ